MFEDSIHTTPIPLHVLTPQSTILYNLYPIMWHYYNIMRKLSFWYPQNVEHCLSVICLTQWINNQCHTERFIPLVFTRSLSGDLNPHRSTCIEDSTRDCNVLEVSIHSIDLL
eukprot:4198_1